MTTSPADPGLDLTALRAIRGRRRGAPRPLLDRIEAHLASHDGYLALSGGKDSVVVADLARQVDPAVPVVWFDSGLEYPEHRAYLERLAAHWRLNLEVVPAAPTALQLLTASGAWDHAAPRRRIPDLKRVLIDIPAAAAHTRHGRGELWGVRAAEAAGRRQLYATQLRLELARACHGCCRPSPTGVPTREQRGRHGGVITRRDGTTAYGPIWDWSTEQVWQHIAAHDLPLSPVYGTLRALGAPESALRISTVLTATGLEAGRVTWLRQGWPQLYAALVQHLPRLAEFV